MKRSLGLFIMGCSCILSSGFAQAQSADTNILEAFRQYRSQYIQEKIFVHTDKSSYVPREICWFRVYCLDAFYNQPSAVSKIAYIELLDKNNLPVLQQKVSLKPGESNGSFLIPVNIPSGAYRFRAYTSWMRNFSPDYYFEKVIRVINPQNLQTDTSTVRNKKIDLQFFPEGGNLVKNIKSKVAFRVTDAYGRGLDCQGTLVNSNGDSVLTFRPLMMGLGNFVFTPGEGETYKAVIRLTGGEQLTRPLPDAYAQGMTMSLSEQDSSLLNLTVRSSAAYEGQTVYLFIHGSHASLPIRHESLVNRQAFITIRPADLEDGISVITVFNHLGEPLCERLYFKDPGQNLRISAETNTEYAPRRKIDLRLSASDQSGNPVGADMSMAVFRLDSLQSPDELNLPDYVYLNSELGFVENPAYYFDEHNAGRRAALDNLMLTHGWRRFIWKDLMKHTAALPEFPPENYGHIIRGRLVNNLTGTPLKDIAVYLSVPSTRTEFRVTTSGDNGKVKFELPGFYGSQEILLQTDPKEDSVSHVEIMSPFSDKYTGYLPAPFPLPAKPTPVLMEQSVSEQVNHIYRGNKLSQFTMQPVDTNTFYVIPDEKYYLDNYVRFQTMEEVIREYVVSSNVNLKKDRFQLYLADRGQHQFFNDPPLILIDGVPFFDANELFQQDPMKIKRLDLVNHEYVLGYKYFSGIINLSTYRGDLNGIAMNPHAVVLDYPGIPEQREFFSPVYETETQIESRMPDYRTLLYWSPDIKTGAGEKTNIPFYSSDLPGRYAVVLMGLSDQGIPGTEVLYFNVKK